MSASTTTAGRRSAALLVAAGVVATAVVAAVLAFGVVQPPQLDPLEDPSFDGAVAYLSWRDEPCVTTVAPDGAQDEVWCDRGGELVAWTDAGLVVRSWEPDGTLLRIDPATGDELGGPDLEAIGDRHTSPRPDVVGPAAAGRDGELEVRLDGRTLWSVEADERYEVTGGWRSPDGAWVALLDSADRLLLVPADGSAPPVVWSEDVEPHVDLVWRGTQVPAV
ncbi:MAG: hypothetical protein WEB09_00615 [Nitriliruptor sp.]